MTNWLESMAQSFEFYMVDPVSWKDTKRIDTIKSCTIDRDSTVETLGSATIDITESVGECYIRVYLVTIQNGVKDKHPLGTVLVQTPSTEFDGKVNTVSMDAFTPLMELKEKSPPIGYSLLKDSYVLQNAYAIVRENVRAPVVRPIYGDVRAESIDDGKDGQIINIIEHGSSDAVHVTSTPVGETQQLITIVEDLNPSALFKKLQRDFVASPNDTWITYSADLIRNANYEFALDALGQIMFSPKQEIKAMQPKWTYDDGNSSILYPEISMNRDLYGIPNVVEVVYSTSEHSYYSRIVNDDPNSPTSTISRGREIIHRVLNPDMVGTPYGQEQIDEYAKNLLSQLSSIEYTITYTHGYCPVQVGDCVRLNYARAGINGIKAKVIRQSIKCEPGCPVTETAVFTTNLWR